MKKVFTIMLVIILIGANGLLFGSSSLLLIQLVAVIFTIIFSALITFLIIKITSLFIDVRVNSEDENTGLDLTQHGEEAYNNAI